MRAARSKASKSCKEGGDGHPERHPVLEGARAATPSRTAAPAEDDMEETTGCRTNPEGLCNYTLLPYLALTKQKQEAEAEAEADGVVHVDNCSDDSQDQEDAAARIKNIHAGRN